MKGQDLIDKLAAQMAPPDVGVAKTNGHATPVSNPGAVADEAVIEKCRAAKNAAKFADLFDHGDVHVHHGGDDSAADLSLLGILAWWTKDEAQLERIFFSSALGRREKWRRRDDYRKRTIRKALAEAGPGYDWSKDRGRERARPIKNPEEAGGLADLPYIGKSASPPAKSAPR